jgi:amino acid transporter
MNFDASKLQLPADAWKFNPEWFKGLGGAMIIAIYDYLGYYNICHMGDEVRNPSKTIPKAILYSIGIIATAYLVMNTCIIAVVPWQEVVKTNSVAALFMEHLYGPGVARAFSWLVIWTAIASVFALLAGYSRVPYAAAKGGHFFPVFAKLHSRHDYPWVALLALGGLTVIFCFFNLSWVIGAAVAVRIVVQFCGQIFAVMYVRRHRPDIVLPFRMWLYPVPAVVALAGWIFLLGVTSGDILLVVLGVLVSGLIAFAVWSALEKRRIASPPRSGDP